MGFDVGEACIDVGDEAGQVRDRSQGSRDGRRRRLGLDRARIRPRHSDGDKSGRKIAGSEYQIDRI
jgi:hypothetical protein